MIRYDMHIHTEYCGHAVDMDVASICACADELDLETIAITDHIYSHNGLPVVTAIRAELSRVRHNCRVIVGAEVDVDGDFSDGRLVTDSLDALDYVVAGFHYVPTVGNYPLSPDDCTMTGEQFLEVWRTALLGIVSNPGIHTLAHPGRLVAASVDLDAHFEQVLAILAEAAKVSAKHRVAWEINELTGMRLNGYYQRQWHRIFEPALEAGVKLVYGSDAHSPTAIGRTVFTEMVLANLPSDCLASPDEILAWKKELEP
ncbi:MAG: PHP domain-containing protein [Sedimentisphaerales bacterium]|nr:PHP domain-containing protein [Sedimentisphaerales bacterium]